MKTMKTMKTTKTTYTSTERQLLARIARLEAQSAADLQAFHADHDTLTSEILALRTRKKHLEDAIRKAIDFGDGHAWWDSEGQPKIEAGGYKLLKETLEAS